VIGGRRDPTLPGDNRAAIVARAQEMRRPLESQIPSADRLREALPR